MRPNLFMNLESIKRSEEAAKKGATPEEQAFYSLSQMYGWQLFNKKANDLLSELEAVSDAAITNGATIEQIGQNAIIISTVKQIVRRLVNKVEDAKEACERQPGG